MELSILSPKKEKKEKIYLDLCLVAYKRLLNFHIDESETRDEEKRTKVDIHKNYINGGINSFNYQNAEYLYNINIIPEKEQEEVYASESLSFKIEGAFYYRIAVTDDSPKKYYYYDLAMKTNSPQRLSYDLASEYLRLNPEHCVVINGRYVFLKDIKKIEINYEDWVYYIQGK